MFGEDAVAAARLKANQADETDKQKDKHEREVEKLKQKHEKENEKQKAEDEKEKENELMQKQREAQREEVELEEEGAADKSLKKKADKTGISMGILKQVYKRGVAAWRTGHRPGTTPEQWGHARVNSFITKGEGTWGGADADIAKKVRDGGHDKGLKESVIFEEEETYNDYPDAAKKNAQMAIDWKEKYGRDEVDAGTAVGWARAHQLAKGENLSADTVGRMSAFNRHRKNSKISAEYKETPWKDRGYVAWLIWGGDEGVDWAMAKMDKISKTESNKKVLFGFDEFVNEKKKSKPKSDKQKIQDLTKKQKGLVKKARDIQGQIKDLAKTDDRKPTDKLQGLLLQGQMQQATVDSQKAAVQKQQIELKSKIKTAKQKEKATDKK